MGTSLTGLTPATTYDALIKVGDNGPLSATAKVLSDGLGNDSILALSTTAVGIGTTTPSTTLDILPPVQTATATQFDCVRVGYSNSTIGVTNGSALQVQVATTGSSRYSTTLRLSGSSDTSQAYLKAFDSNSFGVMLNRTQSNLGLFSDNGIKLGATAFAGTDGAASAMVHIKGSGSTSATTSLLIQDSAGGTLLNQKDNGTTELRTLAGLTNLAIFDFEGWYPTVNNKSTNLYGDGSASSAVRVTGSTYSSGASQIQIKGATSISSGFNQPDASAQLDVASTTKGFLPPRMTNAQRTAIATPAVGLMVYCTDAVEGLYIYKSTGWTFVI